MVVSSHDTVVSSHDTIVSSYRFIYGPTRKLRENSEENFGLGIFPYVFRENPFVMLYIVANFAIVKKKLNC